MYRIRRSQWRKAAALIVAVGVFVLLYETRMLDSHRVAELLLGEDASVEPGAAPLQFSATAYCKGTTTASGVRVRTGIAAADPTLLPVGSVINVDAGDARYSGVYTVMDTGPAVKGRTLDLYIWSCHEALQFGRKRVRVTVLRLGWDPKTSSPSLAERLFKRREAARAREIQAREAQTMPAETGTTTTTDAPAVPQPAHATLQPPGSAEPEPPGGAAAR
jgi:3D (Asp-Asp-Asp) domain-containing protein